MMSDNPVITGWSLCNWHSIIWYSLLRQVHWQRFFLLSWKLCDVFELRGLPWTIQLS